MRILVISNFYPPDVMGGYELGCAEATAELTRRGHEVRVLTSTPRSADAAEDPTRRVLRFTDVYDKESAAAADPDIWHHTLARATLLDARNLAALRSEVQGFDPHVVYLWNLVGIGGIAMALAVDLVGLPWVWHLMDAAPRDLSVVAGSLRHELASGLGRRLRGTWIACSQGLLDEIEAAGATLGDRTAVLPNWVSGPRPQPRTRWYKPGGILRCAFAGRLVRAKGADIAIDALARLAASGHTSIELHVYGDGVGRDALERRAATCGVGDRVHFSGAVARPVLLERLSEMDVFVFPTWTREPFAFAPLEAAGRGCVPLVTAACGNAEWFMDGVHVLKADRDAQAFARSLGRVLEGEIDLEAIGRRAAAIIWSDFHISAVFDRVERLLGEAIVCGGPATESPRSWARAEHLAGLGDRLMEVLLGGGENTHMN